MIFSLIKIILEIIIIVICLLIYFTKSKIQTFESWDFDNYIKNQKCKYQSLENESNIPRFGGIPSKADFWPCLRTVPK